MSRISFAPAFRRSLAIHAAVLTLVARGTVPATAQRPLFTNRVDMVPLTVRVTNTTGRYVSGLTGSDFGIFEDGVRQPVSFFASDEVGTVGANRAAARPLAGR